LGIAVWTLLIDARNRQIDVAAASRQPFSPDDMTPGGLITGLFLKVAGSGVIATDSVSVTFTQFITSISAISRPRRTA
jgi:hypothetical protein